MKVIIIGAGLSGLGTAIALRKYIPAGRGLEVVVYDNTYITEAEDRAPGSKVSTSRLGAGLGLQANGLRVLGDLDGGLRDRVYAAGFPCGHFSWRTAGGWMLGREYLDVLPISRPLLIDCLQQSLPRDAVVYKTVSEVIAHPGRKPIVRFADGSPDESADLVVGADGIRSIVRRDLFGNGEESRPQYSGQCAVGGVLGDQPLPQSLLEDPTMNFFVGPTGVFGYTGLSQGDGHKLLYWSVYETAAPPARGSAELEPGALQRRLLERHGGWADPVIGRCLRDARLDNVYPIFVMPDLPAWGRDGCVLVGDAAHALPPRTGQGASQAFEDAQALALLLAAATSDEGDEDEKVVEAAVERAIHALHEVRLPRVAALRAAALRWKEPKMPASRLQTWALYAALWVLIRVKNFTNLFRRHDAVDVKEQVREYLAKRSSCPSID